VSDFSCINSVNTSEECLVIAKDSVNVPVWNENICCDDHTKQRHFRTPVVILNAIREM
jgi:hypothetical protein